MCRFFSSFFMAKLEEGGTYNYSFVERWTKRLGANYLTGTDLIIIPYHQNNAHWALFVVDLKQKCLLCYDSLPGKVSARV